MKDHQARELLKKHKDGTLTAQERAQLESWYLAFAKSKDPVSFSEDELETKLVEVWNALPLGDEDDYRKSTGRRHLRNWIAGVASVLILCTLGTYYYLNKINIRQLPEAIVKQDILPGGNRAVLTLDDGEKIFLNDAKIGTLAKEGHTAISKTEEGQITYHTEQLPETVPPMKAKSPSYNTLSTPKAGQYEVQLPDGTHVWLNALSSIRFPSTFPPQERIVEITGEVYFEVAKVTNGTKNIPFRVIASDQVIEVLGTRFNVNTYKDEEMTKTTLLEGSIKINMGKDGKKEILLKPGQQIRIAHDSQKGKDNTLYPYTIEGIDTQSIVSWKDGYFSFDNMGLPDLMRQISRWYDVEVVYETPVKEYEFMGKIERSAKLSKVLKILELGGVHFRIEGNKVIVI